MERRAIEAGGYKDLVVWQRSMDLAQMFYEVTREWPADERFGLTDQVRRAAVSIPANIAEGHGRGTPREFHHHCSIAKGSLSEVETHLLLAHRLDYLDQIALDRLTRLTTEVARMLRGFMNHLRSTTNGQSPRSS